MKIIHHLLFRASEKFTKYIEEKGMSDLKYLNDSKFFKAVGLVLVDLFGYRTELSE